MDRQGRRTPFLDRAELPQGVDFEPVQCSKWRPHSWEVFPSFLSSHPGPSSTAGSLIYQVTCDSFRRTSTNSFPFGWCSCNKTHLTGHNCACVCKQQAQAHLHKLLPLCLVQLQVGHPAPRFWSLNLIGCRSTHDMQEQKGHGWWLVVRM